MDKVKGLKKINQPNWETCDWESGFYVLVFHAITKTLKIQIGRFLLNLIAQHILKQF